MKKQICGLALTFGLCVTTLTGCQIGNTDYVLDIQSVDRHSVFQINDRKCSVEEAKLYFCNYKSLYGTVYGVDLWDYDFGEQTLPEYAKAVTLSELTRIMAMDLLAEQYEMTLTEEELALCEKAAGAYYDSLTDDEIDYMDVNRAKLQEYYEHYALAEKLYETLTEGVNEEVSDDEARVIRIMQIYVESKDEAKEVKAKLNAGEDFANVASNYNRSGTIELTAARGELPEEVEEAAFELENDEISGPIQTEKGYYFVKCISKYEKDLTEANKVTILGKREKEQFNDVYDEFLAMSDKALNEDVWEELEIDSNMDIKTDSFFSTYDEYFTKDTASL